MFSGTVCRTGARLLLRQQECGHSSSGCFLSANRGGHSPTKSHPTARRELTQSPRLSGPHTASCQPPAIPPLPRAAAVFPSFPHHTCFYSLPLLSAEAAAILGIPSLHPLTYSPSTPPSQLNSTSLCDKASPDPRLDQVSQVHFFFGMYLFF